MMKKVNNTVRALISQQLRWQTTHAIPADAQVRNDAPGIHETQYEQLYVTLDHGRKTVHVGECVMDHFSHNRHVLDRVTLTYNRRLGSVDISTGPNT